MTRKHRGPSSLALTSPTDCVLALLNEAQRLLGAADYRELHKVECQYDEGVLILQGVVSRYYLKQRAYHVVAIMNGINQVSNEIEVQGYGG